MAAVSLFRDINMAAVTSCENTLLTTNDYRIGVPTGLFVVILTIPINSLIKPCSQNYNWSVRLTHGKSIIPMGYPHMNDIMARSNYRNSTTNDIFGTYFKTFFQCNRKSRMSEYIFSVLLSSFFMEQ